jgi:hypothetical protein
VNAELARSCFAGFAAYSRTGNAVHVVRIATGEIDDTPAVAADAFQERFGGRYVTVKEVASTAMPTFGGVADSQAAQDSPKRSGGPQPTLSDENAPVRLLARFVAGHHLTPELPVCLTSLRAYDSGRNTLPRAIAMLSKVVPFAGKRRPPNAGKGRTRGVPNKVTALLKDSILVAAKAAGGKDGLVGYLKLQAIKNPQAFQPISTTHLFRNFLWLTSCLRVSSIS